jgi:DNA mismatch repair protein MutL
MSNSTFTPTGLTFGVTAGESTSPPVPPDIHILPPHLVHKIAAGEVIERPASVVKELVENALDAGASHITVDIEDDGRHIRVADNGHGMTPENLRKAFINHATSKLVDEKDLFAIHTLGFRGEALASMSAIAKVTCATRTADAADGICMLSIPGQPVTEWPTGCAVGTIMTIQDLFYTTPARLKFLKKPATELAHIQELTESLALSHPSIRFTLTSAGKVTLATTGSGVLAEVIKTVYGDYDGLAVHRYDSERQMTVTGWVTTPNTQKATKRWMALFVNGRTVKCPVLTRAVEAAYENLLPPKRYPVAVIQVNMPFEAVDVNVHPSKREVRYAEGSQVFGLVRAAIQEALEQQGFWQKAGFMATQNPTASSVTGFTKPYASTGFSSGGAQAPINSGAGWQLIEPLYQPLWSGTQVPPLQSVNTTSTPIDTGADHVNDTATSATPVKSVSQLAPNQFRVIGQLLKTYMLVETAQGLMVVDQHIASERILFEQFSLQCLDTTPDGLQPLLVPIQRQLRPAQSEQLAAYLPELARLGIKSTLTSAHMWVIESLPALLQDKFNQGIIDELLNRLDDISGQQEGGSSGTEGRTVRLPLHDVIATMACHAAVRAGDELSHEDMSLLMQGWLACQLPWSCPHGRPIAHTIGAHDLNRYFDRPSLPKYS